MICATFILLNLSPLANVLFSISVSVTIPDSVSLSKTTRQDILLRHMVFAAAATEHSGGTVAMCSLMISPALSQVLKVSSYIPEQRSLDGFLIFRLDDDLVECSDILPSLSRRNLWILPYRGQPLKRTIASTPDVAACFYRPFLRVRQGEQGKYVITRIYLEKLLFCGGRGNSTFE